MVYWALVKKDLKFFLRHAFNKTVSPGEQYLDNWHIDAIVHSLMMGLAGERPRQIINLPPRALKSFIVSVAFAAFAIGHDPSCRIMCVSYSDDLAKVFARDFRRIVDSEWYHMVFPKVHWTKLTENEAVTDRGGGRYAISVGGSLTGRGADMILIDDPIKAADAQSENSRTWTSDWFKNTLSSRLNDKKRGLIIVVMQRVHVGDLTGELDSAEFHKLSFPAIAERSETIPLGPRPEDVYHRQVGEALHAQREDLETLEKLKKQMGPEAFSAQYQQRPQMPSGNLFKLAHFKIQALLKKSQVHPHGKWWLSIDAAASTSAHADYSALTWGYSAPGNDGPLSYVLETHRGRWDFEELLVKAQYYVQRLAKAYPDAKLHFIVENASAGTSLIHALRKRGHEVITQNSKNDKTYRAHQVLNALAEGRVTLVRQEGEDQWFDPFMAEVLTFPSSRYDDQVDSFVYGLIFAELRVRLGYQN